MENVGTVTEAGVRAAWDNCRILESRTSEEERLQAQQRIQEAIATYGRDEVSRGTVFLIDVLISQLIEGGDGGEEGQLDPLTDLIPAVIRRLARFELADPAQVPMVTGALMAAAMGLDAVAWRDQFGPIQPKEALNLTFVLWLAADLFDAMAERPGTADQLLQEAFNSLAEQQS